MNLKKCYFCQLKTKPSYKEVETLERFLSQRKKILGRKKTGLCCKCQRSLTKQVKYARFLALIPYVSYQGLK
ncbi:MAG: 30S ribosomal protein S18 [Patescibacteria group bacterium]|nr:30S ribosomal protein S18 [Patescibacteria group bacterium]